MNLETTQSQPVARLTREISIILVGTILLTLSAKIMVPFYPVPMSTQTLVVLGLGLFLGPVRSSLVVVAYLFEGLLGLPVFAGTPPAPARAARSRTATTLDRDNPRSRNSCSGTRSTCGGLTLPRSATRSWNRFDMAAAA